MQRSIESLEERLAPATCVWDGGSPLNSNWSTAANWVGDVAPVPGVDDLQFPATAARKANTNDFVGAAFRGIAFTGSNYVLGGNALTLGGNLTTGPGAISDYLNLALTLNANRTFQLGAGSVLTVNGVLGGPGGFTKAGAGLLMLRGANTYAGVTQVSQGSLYVEHPSALGSTAGGTIIARGAAIRLINIPGPVVFPPELLTFGPGPATPGATLVNSVSDATWTGPVTLDPGENDFVAEPGKTLRFSGAIGGTGGFRHISSGGILEFAGTAPNTYAGATEFARGTLRLNRPAGVTAIPGALAIGTDDAGAGVVKLLAADQIADSSAVTLVGCSGFFGTLNLNGFPETVGSLSGRGGHVVLGGGALTSGTNNSSTVFGGDLTGAGGLTKIGGGTFTLTGASTYTGPTAVRAGTLRVDGSLNGAVTVSGSGTLSGSGTTGGVTATAGVTVNPGGTGPGILTAVGSVTLGPGSSLVVELNGTAPGGGYDQLRVTGAGSTVSLGGSLSVQVGFAPAGQSFTIINNGGSGPVAGTFGGLPEGALVQVGARTFRITYRGGDGNDVVLTHLPAAPQAGIAWRSQFGGLSPFTDSATAVATDGLGNVYVVGYTDGSLPGQFRAGSGGYDADVRKYDLAGDVLWTSEFGSGSNDQATGVAVDGSGVYVVGYTEGTLPHQTSAGGTDAFVRKYDLAGTEQWTRQFGTSDRDGANGVAVDASHTSAGNFDVFVRKYDVNGKPQWTQQFGSAAFDAAYGVAVDGFYVYVVGQTFGTLPGQTSLGGADAFVSKLNVGDGKLQWIQQFGTGLDDSASGVTLDASGVYIAGVALGTDAFVRKYGFDEKLQWDRRFGTPEFDAAGGVAVDGSGVYVAGITNGSLAGQANAGGADAFVTKWDPDGNVQWYRQFGTSNNDGVAGIATNALGVYLAENIGAVDRGGFAFVRKLDDSGNELWNFALDPGSGDEARDVTAGGSGVYVAGENVGLSPANDAFVAKIKEATPPAVVRPGARVAGPAAGAAPTPAQPAQVVGAASRAFALRSTFAPAPPEMGAIDEPLTGGGGPEPLAATRPGSGEGQDIEAPRSQEAGRVLGTVADYPLDEALLDGVFLEGLSERQVRAARAARHGRGAGQALALERT